MPVFLKRPSFHQDEGVFVNNPFVFLPELSGKQIMQNTDRIDSLLEYLDGLDLDSTEKETSINEVRELLQNEEKLKAEIAEKSQASEPISSDEEFGDFAEGDAGTEELEEFKL